MFFLGWWWLLVLEKHISSVVCYALNVVHVFIFPSSFRKKTNFIMQV